MNIAIVDDHQLFRKSLALLVDSFEGISVAYQAENGREFLEKLASSPVDLVLLDIQMPEMDGFETCKILKEKYPDLYIIIISQLTTKESVHKVMEMGANGFFTKNSNPEQLEEAIKSVRDKGYYFGNELGSILRDALLWEKNANQSTIEYMSPEVSFTSREIDIIKLAAKEYSSREIADELSIAPRTVETHRRHLMEKTDSKNIIGVVIFALKYNLVKLSEI
jgi:DNA-binding NarL/FixJ family response regulator